MAPTHQRCEAPLPEAVTSNCLIFAWRRWRRRGGYLLIRRSRHGWWPHFLHGELNDDGQVQVTHLVPVHPLPARGWRRWLPVHALLFAGRVRREDAPDG